jgi:hypothetical protein
MYKKEHDKNTIKKSVNLFSFLDDTEDETTATATIEVVAPEKVTVVNEITKQKFKKELDVSHGNNIEDEMFKQYYGRKVYKNEKKISKAI